MNSKVKDFSSFTLDLSNQNLWSIVLQNQLKTVLKPQLVIIDLSTNHLSYESTLILADYIRRNEATKVLSIVDTHITCESSKLLFEAVSESNIEEFYGDDNIFNDEVCVKIGEMLKNNLKLKVLSLCGCDISAEGVKSIASGLKENTCLEHIRLESNSMYDSGAKALGDAIKDSQSLNYLGIGDNMIWMEGTNAIINSAKSSNLEALDLAYNIVNLNELGNLLQGNTKIKMLSISGCKVRESDLINFLKILPKSTLKTLIMDGFNFQLLPVTWPKVKDTLWSNQNYFNEFLNVLCDFQTIEDLRLGFLSFNQIKAIQDTLSAKRKKDLTISLHDFGKSSNCWIYNFPSFKFISPSNVFAWFGSIKGESPKTICEIIKNTSVIDSEIDVIDTIDFAAVELNNSIFTSLYEYFYKYKCEIKNIDLSDNELTDEIVYVLVDYLTKNDIESINLMNNMISDEGYQTFFSTIEDKIPPKFSYTIVSNDQNELALHKSFIYLGKLIENNCKIENLKITGPVTSNDVYEIVSKLSSNSNIKVIEIETTHTKKYENPDPEIKEEVQKSFDKLYEALWNALNKKSQSKLHTFIYPLFTDVFVYSEAGINLYPAIESKLEYNKGKQQTKKH